MEELNKIHCQDWITNTIPDKSVQLIIADPPYFEVKGAFDFVWASFEEYLKDVEKWAIECKRVLADNGTLIWWGDAKKIAYSQIIFDKHFRLINSMVWQKKDSMQYQYYSIELSRSFNTHNERLLVYDNEFESEEWAKTGLERILEEHIAPKHPFSIYLKSEFKKAGVTNKEIAALFPSKTGGLTGCVSNWLNGQNTITEEQYLKIREYLNGDFLRKEYDFLRKEYDFLRKEYEDLRKEYEDLRKEYEDLRRPFNNKLKLEEVLTYSQESHVTRKYKHDTKKPERLTMDLIETCSKPNDLILIPFAGSGTECAMAARTKRNFIGYDIEQKYVDMANKRCKYIFQTPTLF